MNNMLRLCLLPVLLIAMASAPSMIWAQHTKHSYEGPGNWFVGIDLGTSLALNENVSFSNALHTEVPSSTIQFGRSLTPVWSLRVTGGVSSQMGHPSAVAKKFLPEMFTDYQFFCAISTFDVMFNLSNCLRPYNTRNWFDFYIIAGGGGLYRFYVDRKVRSWYSDVYPVHSNRFWYWTGKLGFEGAWHVSRSLDIVAELDVHATDNAYNGVTGGTFPVDIFVSPRVGSVYYFNNGKRRHRFANIKKYHRFWKELN